MLRAALLCLSLLAVTWLEFQIFPGHSYLQSGTQVYVPVLQRLNTPGYLSRDLLSQTPDIVSYTIYDEVTLFLHDVVRLTFQQALQWQQFLFRLAAIVGLFLLARSTGLTGLLSVLLAALVSLGTTLAGPAVSLTDPEPLPSAFSACLILVAMGLFVCEKPLLSGFAAGLALCYDPVIALPFWLVLLAAFVFDQKLRKPIRPMAPILLIFILLLANLSQLQPGVAAAGQGLFSKISPRLAELQRFRTPNVWVAVWAGRESWHYVAVAALGVWAAVRIWPVLNQPIRWLVLGIGVTGLTSVLFSYLLLDCMHYAVIAEWQPSTTLVLTAGLAALLFGLAGMRAILLRRLWEAFGWFMVLFALPINFRILELLHIFNVKQLGNLLLCGMLAGVLTWLLVQFRGKRWRFAALLIPVAAMFILAYLHRDGSGLTASEMTQIRELADWAERDTWGSSMFLFPDAAKNTAPGAFRAESRRAVWADWTSGVAVDYSELNGLEWWSRWESTMDGAFSAERLQSYLALPIDYYVLKRRNRLNHVRAVFTNDEFLVYDAQDLRNAPESLRLAH
jgi:hypothetical protein